MKLTPITVVVDGKEHALFKRRLKYRERTRLGGILRDGIEPTQKVTSNGDPVFDDNGEPTMIISIPVERVGNYRLELIHLTLCNDTGKPFFTRDEIDEWDTPDIDRVVDQIERDNNMAEGAVEAARGNSEATASEGTSSISV